MQTIRLAFITIITLGIAAGQALAGTIILYSDDFDDLSQATSTHGAAAAGVDTETGSRTVFGHDGTITSIPGSEFQVNFPVVSMTALTNVTFTFDTVLRVNSPLNNLVVEVRNEGAGAGDFHRLYTSINGPAFLEAREYVFPDTEIQNHDGANLPAFPFTDSDSDYFTLRIEYDFPSKTWTVSSDHTGSMTVLRSFTRLSTIGEFDRVRLRLAAASSAAFSSTRYFVDSALVCLTTGAPPPPIVVTTGLVDNVMSVAFESENGKNYQLECTTNDVDWTAANSTILGLGQTETAFDPTGVDPNKKYRVVTLP
jgi:hypothetical protein